MPLKNLPLVYPGTGLLTVTTGGQMAGPLFKFFPVEAKDWSTSLEKRDIGSTAIVGIPSDAGAGLYRGAAAGPLALRSGLYARRPELAKHDVGDVPCIPQLVHDEMYTSKQLKACREYLKSRVPLKKAVSPLNLLADTAEQLFKAKKKVIVLGGDHSISWGPFEALRRLKMTKRLGVLHIDAHTDLMSDRLGIKYCFATWANHALGFLGDPSAFAQVGVRISRKTRSEWEEEFGLKQYWMKDLEGVTPQKLADMIAENWIKARVEHIYVSIDIDGLDPKYAPSTGTRENGGMNPDFVKKLLKNLLAVFPWVGADLVEVAPVLGSASETKITVQSALDLLEEFFV